MGGGSALLLAVELDDELLVDRDVDLLPEGELPDRDLEPLAAPLEPRRKLTVERVEVVSDDDEHPGLVLDGDDVTLAHPIAGDRDPLAVDEDVAVADELAGLGPARAPAGPVGDVVEAQLEVAQQHFAGHAVGAVGLLVEVAELL